MDRELDQQIARLLGWTWNERSAWSPCGSMWARVKVGEQGPDDPWAWLPHYSTSIEEAWNLVEKLCADNWRFSLRSVLGTQWECQLFRGLEEEAEVHFVETAPLAICQCALAALFPPRAGARGERGTAHDRR